MSPNRMTASFYVVNIAGVVACDGWGPRMQSQSSQQLACVLRESFVVGVYLSGCRF